jgi:hypothetical protein
MTMRLPFYLVAMWLIICGVGCSVSRQSWSPGHKYAATKLQKDYKIFRSLLEESHPGLYWFTPKDSMDYYFDYAYNRITDSMTEPQFKTLLQFVTNKIRCGHTSVKSSRRFSHYLDTANLKVFPLSFRVWPEHMVLTGNLHRRDSTLRRGTVITRLDGYPVRQLTDTFLNFLSWDGNSFNGKYQVLSNRGTFAGLYQSILAPKDSIAVGYIDAEDGLEKETTVAMFSPKPDSSGKIPTPARAQQRNQPRPQVLNGVRSMQIDTSLSSLYMTLNTFARGNQLRPFFRKAFRLLKEHRIRHLVIDVRSNGGGDAGLSTLLTRYIAKEKFKLADSLYANNRRSKYSKYIKWQPIYWSMMLAVTKKKKDGKYHFHYFEDHYFYPKKKNHFDGDVYIITGGNSFSATTLFAKALQGQKNVTIIGEETGGGAYGNSAWMIPDVVLPNTKIRFRLPRFRLVMDKDLVKEGRGLMPDVEVGPTPQTIRLGIDPKVETVRKLIVRRNGLVQQ